jgi:2-polyprenyl-6-methoxyphenol hydroxylase-like FAD-dependent oxidoreductase
VIAGGGFAGLTVAVALLQRGWSVTVCERASSVRSEGYNIAFHENGLRTLEVLGLLDRAIEGAQRMPSRQTRDRHGRVTADFDATYRVYRVSRPHLAGVLAEEAQRLGSGLARRWPAPDPKASCCSATARSCAAISWWRRMA